MWIAIALHLIAAVCGVASMWLIFIPDAEMLAVVLGGICAVVFLVGHIILSEIKTFWAGGDK